MTEAMKTYEVDQVVTWTLSTTQKIQAKDEESAENIARHNLMHSIKDITFRDVTVFESHIPEESIFQIDWDEMEIEIDDASVKHLPTEGETYDSLEEEAPHD